MNLDWIQFDALKGGSRHTEALKESIATQTHRMNGALSELDRILIGFWTGKIEVDAVCLVAGNKSVRVYVADVTEDLASKVCKHISARKEPKVPACFVKGASKICFVLGLPAPPRGLDEWVITHIEKLDPAVTV
jgi:hypothetical protein